MLLESNEKDNFKCFLQGLTASVFWECHDEILRVPQDDMENFIRDLVLRHADLHSNGQTRMMPPTPIERVGGRISLSINSEISADVFSAKRPEEEMGNDYCYLVINSSLAEDTSEQSHQSACVALIRIDMEKKAGDKSLAGQLPAALQFMEHCLSGERRVCVSCDTENNDLSVVVALAALQSFFDDDGRFIGREEAPKPSGTSGMLCQISRLTDSGSASEQAKP